MKTIFSVFSITAEDTHIPIDAFRLMFTAISGSSVSELQLRKWLTFLINRSLVLVSRHPMI